MPLPMPGQSWPPPALQPALDRMRTWETWWSGDPDALATHYAGGRQGRASQHAGGVVGALARMWWGRPAAPNEPNTKLHVPLAGDICRTSANLLFGEPFTATGRNGNVTDELDALLDEGTQSKLLEAAELQAALGGVYLRPVADPTLSDRAWLEAVPPDAAIPEWKWGRLAAVTFWRVVGETDKFVWRHFEHHAPGYIVHALYQGEGDNVGRPVPLTEHPATEGFAVLAAQAAMNAGVEQDDAIPLPAGAVIPTGYDKLTACYIPNMRPAPLWRRNPLLAPMGRSDLDGIEPILDALDEVYSSWMRDIRLAKGRIVVGESMLDDQGPGRGARFDPDREAFTVAPGMMPKDVPITVAQFGIRVEPHRVTAHELLTVALRKAGYALITLGEVEGGQAITATEVKAKGQLSFVTMGRKRGYWTPVLEREALPALLAVDAVAFGRPMPDLTEISVEWPDAIAEDLASLAGTAEILHRAESASTETRVRIIHPDWSDPEVKAEAALILDEAASQVTVAPFNDGFGDTPGETDDLRDGPPADDEDDVEEGAA